MKYSQDLPWKPFLGLVAAMFVIGVFIYAVQTGRGYHLQWSKANFRYIWVDKDGKAE